MVFVITGAIGCYIMGVFLDKTKKYLFAIRCITISLLLLVFLSLFLLPLGKLWITCIFAFFVGLLSVPILPACYQYAGTLTGKLPPAVVNGLMMSAAQSWACIFSLIETFLLSYG